MRAFVVTGFVSPFDVREVRGQRRLIPARSASRPEWRGRQPSTSRALVSSTIDGRLTASIQSSTGGTPGSDGTANAVRAAA